MNALPELNPHAIAKLPADKFRAVLSQFLGVYSSDRRENQLLYYQPNSDRQREVHLSTAKILGVGGGNRSGKTESIMAELAMLSTGIFPITEDDELSQALRGKFRGPINIRVVVESLTTVLHQVMLAKLQYWKWQGIDSSGGVRGHWGWIPKTCLVDGSWERSWSEKLRTLRVLCRDPEDPDKVIGESMWQFLSKDQDPTDFASSSFHHILHDEPPTWPIWRENKSRVLDVDGRLLLAMTWPDDPAIPVDWIYDEIYEPGQAGPNKDPDIDWHELFTTENKYLDLEQVAKRAAGLDEQTRKVRIFGQPIRFSNRIHPLYTDISSVWSFAAGKEIMPVDGKCPETGSKKIARYCHCGDFDPEPGWPVIFLLDPHPRKPHMWLWVACDPNDDLWVVAEGELEGDCVDVAKAVTGFEANFPLHAVLRLIDPNMGRSPASTTRGVTWQDEFSDAGLGCDLADDSGVGRQRLNQYLKPDEATQRPRLHVHSRCVITNSQMKRFAWDEFRFAANRDTKQVPKDKYSDMPTLLKYLMNFEPTFHFLKQGAPILGRPGKRVGAYG